ncbi:hypothetical protein E2C01_045126 [Portunus trituberculatus]|uniref:Uncharacterized protein n=1 Tax=Portunus trituberculatus TaxID=210409 RepID=A0A5B7FXF7_PORTR|nr:hypothetical protein [Portunus trituberculatus]
MIGILADRRALPWFWVPPPNHLTARGETLPPAPPPLCLTPFCCSVGRRSKPYTLPSSASLKAFSFIQCEQVLCGLATVLRNATYIKRVDGSGGCGRGGGKLGVWQAGARKNRSDGVAAEKASWWLHYVMFYHLEFAAVNASWSPKQVCEVS